AVARPADPPFWFTWNRTPDRDRDDPGHRTDAHSGRLESPNRCRRLDRPHRGRFLLRSVRTHHLGNRRRPRHSDGEKLKSPTLLGLSNHQRPILFLPPARLFWVNAWIQASLASTPQADPPPGSSSNR